MKKVLLVGMLGVFALASCKKDYTCSCTSDGKTQKYPIKDQKKKDAKDACEALEAQYQSSGASAKCSLD